jgi:hypothetical protein
LTPNEALSAANVVSAVASASTAVRSNPYRRRTAATIANSAHTAPSFSIVPSQTNGSFSQETRCVAIQIATLPSIDVTHDTSPDTSAPRLRWTRAP